MMANFADGGKTIIITGAPAPAAVAQEAPPPPPSGPYAKRRARSRGSPPRHASWC